MKTIHKVYNNSSQNMQYIKDESVDLVVTSPPYPGVEMWDECFSSQSEIIRKSIENGIYLRAWQEMHKILDNVWSEVIRVVKPGGLVCINIGDATRTINDVFQLYSNHSRIIEYFVNNGFVCLPDILWRKRTNSPNKFMGSGMLPAGAYVTLEHEYILVFRKGGKRVFSKEEKDIRQRSAYFYSERNEWFSDVWELMGVSQKGVKGSRERNASYPIEIPYRLINMYSIQGDVVLDPFGGLGTTMLAAIILGRNSLSVEIDKVLCEYMKDRAITFEDYDTYYNDRINKQEKFIRNEVDKGKDLYYNENMKLSVKTRQEQKLIIPQVKDVERVEDYIICEYI